VLQRRMTMFEFSNNQHCILISSRVVDQVKGLIRVDYYGVKQPNMEIQNNLQTTCRYFKIFPSINLHN
jgi:hypothetical protein